MKMVREMGCQQRSAARARVIEWMVLFVLAMVSWSSGCAGVVGGQNSGGNQPPKITISGVTSSTITSTGAVVSWTTNAAGTSQVEYGASSSYGQSSLLSSTLATSHSVTLSSLQPSTAYHFRADSKDANGNLASSQDFTFTTLPANNPPTVSITAPSAGTTVSATVTVSATSSSSAGISSVQFQVDGSNVGTAVTAAPYSFSWNTATVADGNHALTAVAKDTAGNSTTSAGVTVNVSNAVAKPTVSITSPTSGATVSGTITVSATASSSIGIASVQFQIDGANVGAAVTVAPYNFSWNTTTVANGNHALTAVAKDTAGSTTTSAGVTVNVNSAAPKPTVSISAPAAGATVTGTVTVSATATSSIGIASVQFQVDGSNVGTAVTAAPYSFSWNTATVTNGNHTLTAVAKDTAGNSTTSTGVTVNVSNAVAKPTVSITSPAAGATVSGSVTVSANAASSIGIASVQFELDGANLVGAAASTPYATTWDTTTSPNGTHSVTALAKDTVGNSTLSAAVSVTVANNSGTVVNVTPSQDWCGVINSVAPGTTVIMTAGNYTTACSISSSGTASSPIVIRAASAGAADVALLTYQGNSSNVLDVYGAYLQIQWLMFSGMQSGVDAIRLHTGAHDFVAKQNIFQNLGGTAVVYNDSGTTDKISVIGNTVRNSSYTPFYLGCQDGATCHATNVLVDSNMVDTVNPTDGSVGYAIEVKLNSYGTVQNNTFYRTLGPCITVYGSNRGDPVTLVQGNYVQGSMTDAGINISGGPAIVWNNVAVGNTHGGIWAQDYGGRGLQKNVWIAFNTVIGNGSAGIITENWAAGNGDVIAYNAIGTDSATAPLQPTVPLGTITGNVTCTPATTCFDQPTTAPYDLWPLMGGPLIGAGGSATNPWRPSYDFMGAPRGTAADVGAFQRTRAGNGPSLGGGTARPPFN